MKISSHDLQKSIRLFMLFCTAAGFLLHFAFTWSGDSPIVALFAPVNESVWEHEKLLFYPFTAGAWFLSRRKKISAWTFPCMSAVLTGLVFIPGIYYTYTGALGIQADWFNIIIFVIAVLLSCTLYGRLLQRDPPAAFLSALGGILLFLMLLLFIVFTFITPEIPLFQDPVNGTFGYQP
ncbi:MAG: DUF6512 family protein [Lachnospiraceae bacterium]